MKSIGIIGQGFVGTAVRETMQKHFEVCAYDKKWGGIYRQQVRVLLRKVDGPIFICLPTPMNPDGSCNISIVKGVLDELDDKNQDNPARDIIIKSTMPLGMTRQLNSQYKSLNLIFNPEFLTEKNATEDYANQDRIILGSTYSRWVKPYSRGYSVSVQRVFETTFPKAYITWESYEIAEMVKYVTNVLLATKVSLMNELKQVLVECPRKDLRHGCEDLFWECIVDLLAMDKRLGESHWRVPGECGKPGFGGSCFPKDLNAMIYTAKQLGVKPTVMEAVWKKNLEVRPEKDWEELKGRAVTEDGR